MTRSRISVFTGLFLLAISGTAASADAGGAQGNWGGHMWDGWGSWFMGPFMGLFWIVAVVLIIVMVMRWTIPDRVASPPEPSRALSVLEERFARGEIDRDEFIEKKKILGK